MVTALNIVFFPPNENVLKDLTSKRLLERAKQLCCLKLINVFL